MPDWIKVASIVRPRGLKGEVVADAGNWSPDELLEFPRLVLLPGERPVELQAVWPHQQRLVLKFREIDSVEQAETLRNAELCIPREDRPPAPSGEYYFSDLTGCRVMDHGTGEELGVVTACLEYGGPLVLQVKCGERELLIPFANAICKVIDVANKRIAVDLPEGLKEL